MCERETPLPVATSRSFARVDAGWFHTCRVTTADEAVCGGWNDFGQLGDGGTDDSSVPVRVVP